MLEKITVALKVKNNDKKNYKEKLNSKINYIFFKDLKELFSGKENIKTEYILILDKKAKLNENFIDILNETILEEDKLKIFLFSLIENGETKVYNTSVLKSNDYTNLVSFIGMAINGLLIPTSYIKNNEFKFDDEIIFYNDLNLYLQILKTNVEIEVIPKILFTLETDEYDFKKYEKEYLDKEINKMIKINE